MIDTTDCITLCMQRDAFIHLFLLLFTIFNFLSKMHLLSLELVMKPTVQKVNRDKAPVVVSPFSMIASHMP